MGADTMSDASKLSLLQSALKLLHVQKQHNIDIDLGLAWDPLLLCTDIMAEVRHASLMSAGPTFYCVMAIYLDM